MCKEEKIRCKALIILVLMTLFVAPSGVFAEMSKFTLSDLKHAKAVHAHHVENLLRLPGVKGVGIGETFGRLGILLLVDDESRLPKMPGAIEDLSAVTRVVGEITAHAINLGTSGGNSLVCSNYCTVGTVGFKVCDNTTSGVGGIITNNHVAVSGCPNLCPNNAPIGTTFFSPGVADNDPVCSTTGATAVGTLNRYMPISLGGFLSGANTNYMDAAFVQSTDSLVSNNIQDLGPQNNTVVSANLGQTVCMRGRTSGVTCGTVTGINLTVSVDYGKACGVGRFNNTIMYLPTAPYKIMSQSGDSGAPVVDANSNAAVALNFAGTETGIGFGNPIGPVLSALQVSLCDSTVAGFNSFCAATMSDDFLKIHVPIAVYGTKYYSADMQHTEDLDFVITNTSQLINTSATCLSSAPVVSSDLSIHMPVIMFYGVSYWADFVYKGNMTFTMTNAGAN